METFFMCDCFRKTLRLLYFQISNIKYLDTNLYILFHGAFIYAIKIV